MPFYDLMIAGSKLMILGMSTVFIFLIILVYALKLMSWLALRFGAQQEIMIPNLDVRRTAKPAADKEGDLITVISAAIARFRAVH